MPIFDDDTDVDGAAVRQHLLRLQSAALASLTGVDWPPRGFKGTLGEQLERDDLPPVPQFTDAQLAMPFGSDVRALAAGEEFAFNRGDLPDWHPARWAGALSDALVLTEGNELVAPR